MSAVTMRYVFVFTQEKAGEMSSVKVQITCLEKEKDDLHNTIIKLKQVPTILLY